MSRDDRNDLFTRTGRLWSPDRDKDRRQPAFEQDSRTENTGGPSMELDGLVIPKMRSDRTYAAFKIAQRPERLHIDRAIQASRFLAYHYLVDMNFDPALESIFTLFYTSVTVEVTGDRLWPVVYAIWHGKCESIHAYHPQLYERPPKDAPFIDAIKLSPPASPDGPPFNR